MKVLVINAGSSSIKYQLYEMPEGKVLAKGEVERIGEGRSKLCYYYDGKKHCVEKNISKHEQAVELILDTLVGEDVGVIGEIGEIGCIGHRVVHGGEEFSGSVIIDEAVIASIEKFSELAPLHNSPNLIGIRACQGKLPDIRHVACFDTAFHATLDEVAYMYALPYEFYERHHIRRYGFHGVSHRYVARRAAAVLGRGKYEINAITCHLGNGCSITAVREGRPVDTSMGFTPLEGLAMGTRSGDFDPAILFYLVDKGYDIETLKKVCNKKSGLLGVSGASNDMRTLEELAGRGHERAKLAVDIFCYRVRKYIGAYGAVLGDVDAVVFTGGIGENSVLVREQVCSGLGGIGIELDGSANAGAVGKEADISGATSKVRVLVIPTNEEAAIAKDTYELTK
jgi:acetate kinase